MDMFGGGYKYRKTAVDPVDNVPLSWSAHPDGLPIRKGDAPNLIRPEQAQQAGAYAIARSEVLTIPDQLDKYREILDWVLNTTGQMPVERIQTQDGKWVVWLVWADVRGYIPNTPVR